MSHICIQYSDEQNSNNTGTYRYCITVQDVHVHVTRTHIQTRIYKCSVQMWGGLFSTNVGVCSVQMWGPGPYFISLSLSAVLCNPTFHLWVYLQNITLLISMCFVAFWTEQYFWSEEWRWLRLVEKLGTTCRIKLASATFCAIWLCLKITCVCRSILNGLLALEQVVGNAIQSGDLRSLEIQIEFESDDSDSICKWRANSKFSATPAIVPQTTLTVQ